MDNEWIEVQKIYAGPIISLLGIILTAFLVSRYTYRNYLKQKWYENQRLAYSKLKAIQVPFQQYAQLYASNDINQQAHEIRYRNFSKHIEDYNTATLFLKERFEAMKSFYKEQKELFEVLSTIEAYFEVDKELQDAVDSLYKFKTMSIAQLPQDLENTEQLTELYDLGMQEISDFIQNEHESKFENLIKILRSRLKIAENSLKRD